MLLKGCQEGKGIPWQAAMKAVMGTDTPVNIIEIKMNSSLQTYRKCATINANKWAKAV